jgi:UDP-3-O-[3-hydroxymyristoyl] glucosamine N-acyltransferase
MKLIEIAEFLNGELVGDPDIQISGLAKIQSASTGELTFLANPKYGKYLESTKASAVLISKTQQSPKINHIKVDDPYLSFLEVLNLLYPAKDPNYGGIHQTAVVADTAVIGKNVQIGPNVYIGESVKVGDNSFIYPNCVLLDKVQIGKNCRFYPRVSIREGCRIGNGVIIHDGTVVGCDGFGFAPDREKYKKIPQMGIVVIEDDVEIGANSTIDRATIGETVIRKGCKIDNLVQIAHNVEIDTNTVVAAQTGISGSTKIGKHVTIAGQVGTVGHIEIGDNAILAAKSGISKNVPPGEIWFGYPAMTIMKQKKIEASLRRLPEMSKNVNKLIKRLEELEKKLNLLDGVDER